MKRTVYLHMGDGRCGSSAIQFFCDQNRGALRERGVAYPSGLELGVQGQQRAGNAQGIYNARKTPAQAFEALGAFLRTCPTPKILLSSEFLLRSNPVFLQGLAHNIRSAGLQVVAIAYVREQRERLISRYAQALKSRRWTISVEEYLRKAYQSEKQDYFPLFVSLRNIFGREHLVLRIYDRDKLCGGDVRLDLFQTMGTDVADLATDRAPVNASASLEEAEVMRAVNAVMGPSQFNPRRFLQRSAGAFEKFGWKPNKELYRLVPAELMRTLGEHFAEKNEAFRKEFFPQERSPLFSCRIPDHYELLGDEERQTISARSLILLANYFADVEDLTTSEDDTAVVESGAVVESDVLPEKPSRRRQRVSEPLMASL